MTDFPSTFHGRLALQQRVLPVYRAAFMDALARTCRGGLEVFAGQPRAEESIAVTDDLQTAQFTPARNIHILNGALYLCHQPGLLRWLADRDPDALIVEANPRYLATPAAIRWMKRRGRPVIGWGLGAPPLAGPGAGWRKNGRARFLSRFDTLVAYGPRGAQEYAAIGFPADRIFIAPNAVAARPAHPLPIRPPGFGGKPKALFVGRLQARKRVDLLLQACAALPHRMQPELIIIGDGPERAALETLAAGVYPGAVFAGAQHGETLASLFTAADLFVLPGTGGLAAQEAMSYGLPVIMGRGDGTNEALVRSPAGTMPGNGWQVPPDDLAALTAILGEALSDAGRLRRMGAESYRIVTEEVNLENMVGVFQDALERAARG
ncbi:MAG: glycosyltransferase family 4 protein [Chloroflexi bacterium]|nr:glycosyltransferase family 4 protein [Chloroflexota bacterium]